MSWWKSRDDVAKAKQAQQKKPNQVVVRPYSVPHQPEPQPNSTPKPPVSPSGYSSGPYNGWY